MCNSCGGLNDPNHTQKNTLVIGDGICEYCQLVSHFYETPGKQILPKQEETTQFKKVANF